MPFFGETVEGGFNLALGRVWTDGENFVEIELNSIGLLFGIGLRVAGVVADDELSEDGEVEEGIAMGRGEVDELNSDLAATAEGGAFAVPSDGALDIELVSGIFVGEGVLIGLTNGWE